MKQTIFIFMILLCAIFVYAADKALVTPKPLISLEAAGIRSGFELTANADNKTITYSYYWLDANGNRIYPYKTGNGKQIFTAKNWDAIPGVGNSQCVGASDPDPCCVAAHPNAGNSCDDTFDNANCIADGDPLECCKGVGEGVCSGWDDVVSAFIPIKNYLDTKVDLWENIVRE